MTDYLNQKYILLDNGNWDRTTDFINYVYKKYNITVWKCRYTTVLIDLNDFDELIYISETDEFIKDELEIFSEINKINL